MSKKALWQGIRGYHFDNLVPADLADKVIQLFGGTDASTRAFASKIARKLGWQTDFALRAIDEYRKFVYLGVTSPHEVTPPKAIDQVWHEHQLFTRGYREFCRDVLGRHFDHSPELIPSAGQTALFSAQYLATLDLYEREFNRVPPRDIWGIPKFDSAGVATAGYTPRKKRADQSASAGTARSADDFMPLYLQFSSPGDSAHQSSMPEFGGGGGFSGGGSGESWGDSPDSSSSGGESGSGGTGSSDSGSSCSSSSCGGGGGGD